ncbi:hypothetical protein [uncultured Paraglaciecola sp.]|uniref:hypothetical protein n=1 Tax=uncultured Paraglaciecola sp. TaxID=1765024 RepID=UPI002603A1A4|nr:hypothetical protein [uncultured Paraglaciecola sp.]
MKQPFDQVAPPPASFTVSLTLLQQDFASAQDAVVSLENTVAKLSKGVTVTVKGKAHTTKVKFDDWITGLGNKAIWAPKLSELQVAADTERFALSVKGYGDKKQNLVKAIDLARFFVAKN